MIYVIIYNNNTQRVQNKKKYKNPIQITEVDHRQSMVCIKPNYSQHDKTPKN